MQTGERIDRHIHMVAEQQAFLCSIMASIENSIYQIVIRRIWRPMGNSFTKLTPGARSDRGIFVLDTGLIGQAGIRDLDISKIVVSTREPACIRQKMD